MTRFVIAAMLLWGATKAHAQIKLNTPHVESILYVGQGEEQPLIVGLGGSEGGNAWAGNYWKATRDSFLKKGYAFLAIGYFGAVGTPENLDRIAIEDVYKAIMTAADVEHVRKDKIAIVGGSRGADLALLLGSYYREFTCIVGLVPSHAVFPGHTQQLNTSCWTFQGKELPYIPVNEEAVPFLLNRNLRGAFDAMLKDSVAEKKALIPVTDINGPVLLMSATEDEICPSMEMSGKMMKAFDASHFKFHHEHLCFKGGHGEPLKHFDKVYQFLQLHFL
ncbi:putative esterase [Filimonas zeae]|uniref:BAAT/Acyl-CoA thioester hydrolase C-terminal domain-containing protein n=1 Tax=Filimonas zeae TaxID=1737353 RepID=A0A917MSQ9_9BACT|nr:acyl-CoA thioester hydrolase/BAAT C-terminal domain-containing protein [Filimonas zeae]MDR6338003.1 putative esterase [Filimonas zeae]GGH61249.1 hypothetical protein GCM10011379_10030 [Filimonas zeae]